MPSTVIGHFAYDPDTAALDVEFVSGRRYRYFSVPGEVSERFAGAFSKGRFFNAQIRGRFTCAELALAADEDPWGL